jgi:hypothetical protein
MPSVFSARQRALWSLGAVGILIVSSSHPSLTPLCPTSSQAYQTCPTLQDDYPAPPSTPTTMYLPHVPYYNTLELARKKERKTYHTGLFRPCLPVVDPYIQQERERARELFLFDPVLPGPSVKTRFRFSPSPHYSMEAISTKTSHLDHPPLHPSSIQFIHNSSHFPSLWKTPPYNLLQPFVFRAHTQSPIPLSCLLSL